MTDWSSDILILAYFDNIVKCWNETPAIHILISDQYRKIKKDS